MTSHENCGEVYMITNVLNSKKYIGQTKCIISSRKYGAKTRWSVHKYRALKNNDDCNFFYNSIRKNGLENFEMEVLKHCKLDELDYYEKMFIKEYNTLYPSGYNIENGGKLNKKLNDSTKEKISESRRYKYMKNEDVEKLKKLMDELEIKNLPKGIQYSHDTIKNIEGICVIYKNNKKLFSSVNSTLKEKLKLSIEYYKLCVLEDVDKLKEFNEKLLLNSKLKTREKRIPKYKEVSSAMKELNISTLPLYVRFEKRNNRFFITKPDGSCIYFSKNKPTESLKEALVYLKAPVVEGESYLNPQKT
jgi:hypothetical protein